MRRYFEWCGWDRLLGQWVAAIGIGGRVLDCHPERVRRLAEHVSGAMTHDAIRANFAIVAADVGLADAQIEPGARPRLVVKHGSKTWARMSGGMPQLVSVTRISIISTYVKLSAETVIVPHSGVASAALSSKFISTCDNWFA